MAVKTYAGIRTGFGCKVDEDMHGGSYGTIIVAYYECNSIREAAEQALALLDSYYEVTVFSGGYYNPRSYHRKNELRRDFGKWLDGGDVTT